MKIDELMATTELEAVKAITDPLAEGIEDDEDDEEDDDLTFALRLLLDLRYMLDYLADTRLCTTITWTDRKEMQNFVEIIDEFVEQFDLNSDTPPDDTFEAEVLNRALDKIKLS